MFRRTLSIVLGMLVACMALGLVVHAETSIPPIPKDGYVRDDTSTLSSDEITKLNNRIADYKKRTSVQLAVLMIPKLPSGEYLEGYSINVARTWGVGEKNKNNGALLLVVKDERKLRIEVGTGLEGDLTDVRSSRIIRDRIAPQFKAENYYQGVYNGLEGMTLAIGNTADPVLSNESSDSSMGIGQVVEAVLFVGVLVISWLSAILGRSKSWWTGGVIGGAMGGMGTFFLSSGSILLTLGVGFISVLLGLLFDYFVSQNYTASKNSGRSPAWWAGGGQSGGGGGGGFGGGSFGGGGSSGSW